MVKLIMTLRHMNKSHIRQLAEAASRKTPSHLSSS